MCLEPHRLVFIDETAVTTKMTRLRGRSPRGARLKADAPFGHWRTQTFIAGLRVDELTAPWVLDGPMNRAAFDIYIETQLAPILQPGDVVIADNLSSHKSARAQACLKRQGNWMLFLPPYSPDLNPIEMAYAKCHCTLINQILRIRRFRGSFCTLNYNISTGCRVVVRHSFSASRLHRLALEALDDLHQDRAQRWPDGQRLRSARTAFWATSLCLIAQRGRFLAGVLGEVAYRDLGTTAAPFRSPDYAGERHGGLPRMLVHFLAVRWPIPKMDELSRH